MGEAQRRKSITNRFATNLKRERNKAGITQLDLAKETKLDKSFVCLLEAGHRAPSMETVEAIAKALSVEAWTLIK